MFVDVCVCVCVMGMMCESLCGNYLCVGTCVFVDITVSVCARCKMFK